MKSVTSSRTPLEVARGNHKGHAVFVAHRADVFINEALWLRKNGFSVTEDAGIHNVMRSGATAAADVVIIDSVAFGADLNGGLAQVRQQVVAPLIIVAPVDDEIEEIVALELGADDYLVRPLSPRRLLARMRALKRRGETVALSAQNNALAVFSMQLGALSLDRTAYKATWHGRDLSLSPVCFEMLCLLAARAPGMVTREEALTHTGAVGARAVDMFMLRLRRQLQAHDAAGLKVITVRKHGYRLELDGERNLVVQQFTPNYLRRLSN